MSRESDLARYYDLEYRRYADDLAFYVQHATALDPGKKLPVLELGCGTGRVCLALAQAGFHVTGVDLSAEMLALAQEHARQRQVTHRLTSVQADMRDLKGMMGGPFNLALCAANSFAYLLTTPEQLEMLRAVHARLVQHGILILDLTPPLLGLLPPSDGEVVYQGSFVDDVTGEVLHKTISGTADHSTQTHHVTIFYDLEGPDGVVRRTTQNLTQRWTGRYELELLLSAAGYRLEKTYGSYDLDEYAGDSGRMIFVART